MKWDSGTSGKGRGRKPAFSPCGCAHFGIARSRWSLDGLRHAVPWLAPLSLPGVWQVLERFEIAYKRGRRYVHSPDPDYPTKAAHLRSVWQQVQANPTRLVLLYEDELTYYRCPTVFCDYAMARSDAPRAAEAHWV